MIKLPSKYVDWVPLAPGQNALVFRARNKLVNRMVFLKAYPMPAASSRSALREPQLLQQLAHPNLVQIYGADTRKNVEGRHIYLEMELVDGGSFNEIISTVRRTGRWPSVHEAIRLVTDTAAGLAHLHSKGFVHRDIKPANLVIRKQSGVRHGVVTDLGLAGRLDNNTGRAFSSRHSRLYRPPEVWKDLGYSVRSDIYQLGIVLFQLLGGPVNYALGDLQDDDLAEAISDGEFLIWESLPPHIGRPLRSVLEQATNINEQSRFVDMMKFYLALNNIYSKQHNWKFRKSDDSGSFELLRHSGQIALTIEVTRIAGDEFSVQRLKSKGLLGKKRRIGLPARITHSDLGRSQQFQKLISEPW